MRVYSRKKPEFSLAIERLEKHEDCKSLSLNSFLILPVQRIPRLLLLVAAICERVDKIDDLNRRKSDPGVSNSLSTEESSIKKSAMYAMKALNKVSTLRLSSKFPFTWSRVHTVNPQSRPWDIQKTPGAVVKALKQNVICLHSLQLERCQHQRLRSHHRGSKTRVFLSNLRSSIEFITVLQNNFPQLISYFWFTFNLSTQENMYIENPVVLVLQWADAVYQFSRLLTKIKR